MSEAHPADPSLDDAVDRILTRVGRRIVLGLPLGLGKPNALVNALYRRVKADPKLELDIVTALSLDLPRAGSDLERRFLEPFVLRHFGPDYPELDYVEDLRHGRVPPHVRILEFYLQSGASLGNPLAQRHYTSSNYTHVARDLVDRGVNLVLQLVAEESAGAGARRLSLSCNPDVTLDLAARIARTPGYRCTLVAQVHPDLPFMHGDAIVDEDFFDEVLPAGAGPAHRLFAIPRQPVAVRDYWVGLHASTLVEDGGTLQIGIGALGDALVNALILRHEDNAAYRALLGDPAGANDARGRAAEGGSGRDGGSSRETLDPFERGLYGASEMFMDGFMHLYRAGILRREVFDDEETQRRADAGTLDAGEGLAGTGAVMDAAFFLGSRPFYDFLRNLDAAERPRFRMTAVGSINQLYGGNESLEILQRRGARFFNTCMMVTATGAAVSDALADHQVVSGVGGQYNFVAMAHAMEDGRSVIMLRSTRDSGGRATSNIVWEYPHATIPRHLRDIVVTEYGIARLRGATDEECIQALIGVADARFQEELAAAAKDAGKLDRRWTIPDAARSNTPSRLADRARPARDAGLLPDFPFGSDFTDVELRLVPALRHLRSISGSRTALARAMLRGTPADFPEEIERMGLDAPRTLRERASARLVAAALAATGPAGASVGEGGASVGKGRASR